MKLESKSIAKSPKSPALVKEFLIINILSKSSMMLIYKIASLSSSLVSFLAPVGPSPTLKSSKDVLDIPCLILILKSVTCVIKILLLSKMEIVNGAKNVPIYV